MIFFYNFNFFFFFGENLLLQLNIPSLFFFFIIFYSLFLSMSFSFSEPRCQQSDHNPNLHHCYQTHQEKTQQPKIANQSSTHHHNSINKPLRCRRRCFRFWRWPRWWRSGPWWIVISSGPSRAWGHCSTSGALAPSMSSSGIASIRQPIDNPPPQLDQQTTRGFRLPRRRGFVGCAISLDRRYFDLWTSVTSIFLSTLSLWVCVLWYGFGGSALLRWQWSDPVFFRWLSVWFGGFYMDFMNTTASELVGKAERRWGILYLHYCRAIFVFWWSKNSYIQGQN